MRHKNSYETNHQKKVRLIAEEIVDLIIDIHNSQQIKVPCACESSIQNRELSPNHHQ